MRKTLIAASAAAALCFVIVGNAHAAKIINVKVHGLVCDFCAQAIGIMLKRDPAVGGSRINLNNKVVTIKVRNGKRISDRRITQLITAAGYQVVRIAR